MAMFARTTSTVVFLAMLVTLLSITSATPIPGDIQKRGLGDLAEALGHLLQGVQSGVSANNAADYIPDVQSLLGAAPGLLNGLESLAGQKPKQ
ncbi:hypothetical protein EC991_008449 [Linnemannia zychae]|nr:hypothetical protein EC991_008449 [Linnemannia zychae]